MSLPDKTDNMDYHNHNTTIAMNDENDEEIEEFMFRPIEDETHQNHNQNQQPIDLAIQTVKSLYSQYENDSYMFQKTHNYICYNLPSILENIRHSYLERQQRNEELSLEQDAFIKSFLANNQYFYVPTTERFFSYNGENYRHENEDDVLHLVLTTISKEKRILMPRKPQTKVYIMKRIKDMHLFKSVPESHTIQNIFSLLCPAVFSTKAEAKYFLTILGDNLLKKCGTLNYFINPSAKHFIRELSNISVYSFGVNCATGINYKFYEHSYQQSRLIRINQMENDSVWSVVIRQALNILCVAAHYSNRYGCADDFLLNNCNDKKLVQYARYLMNLTPGKIVDSFLSEYIIVVIPGTTMSSPKLSWKNMQYLWKKFLDKLQLPSVIFQQNLKNILIQKLSSNYSAEHDTFTNLSSKYLPSIQNFLQFWDETMVCVEREKYELLEFEIEEIWQLYRNWFCNMGSGSVSLSEKEIADLIAYFYPNVEIEEDKYIRGVRCILWDKHMDIQIAMEQLWDYEKTKSPKQHRDNIDKVSIYDAYVWYSDYYSLARNGKVSPAKYHTKILVSKSYFEKYVCEQYRVDDTYIYRVSSGSDLSIV